MAQNESRTYQRVLHAISYARANPQASLTEAARKSGTTVASIRRYADDAIASHRGRLDVTSRDTLPRRMRFLDEKGELVIRTRDSRSSTLISNYFNDLSRYFQSDGDVRYLEKYAKRAVKARGQSYQFVTDPRTLNRLARAGVISFLDIYASDGGL
jgi:hypothetical protein